MAKNSNNPASIKRLIKPVLFIAAVIALMLSAIAIYAALDHNPMQQYCESVYAYEMQPWTLYWSPNDAPCKIKWDVMLPFFSVMFLFGFFTSFAILMLIVCIFKFFNNLSDKI